VLFDRVERRQVVAMRWSNMPAASSRSTSSSQPVSGSARPGGAAAAPLRGALASVGPGAQQRGRYRPNIVVRTTVPGFAENSWLERTCGSATSLSCA
jgi:hypothetical protein